MGGRFLRVPWPCVRSPCWLALIERVPVSGSYAYKNIDKNKLTDSQTNIVLTL